MFMANNARAKSFAQPRCIARVVAMAMGEEDRGQIARSPDTGFPEVGQQADALYWMAGIDQEAAVLRILEQPHIGDAARGMGEVRGYFTQNEGLREWRGSYDRQLGKIKGVPSCLGKETVISWRSPS